MMAGWPPPCADVPPPPPRTCSPGSSAAPGLLHFVVPGPYADIVPSWLPGDADAYVYASGVAEMACAAAVALPRTRRLGGWATAGLFVAVFPANVTMALQTADGIDRGAGAGLGEAAAAGPAGRLGGVGGDVALGGRAPTTHPTTRSPS